MARRIEVEILGDAHSLERAFGRAGSQGSSFGHALRRLGRDAFYAGAALGGALVVGLTKSVKASMEMEASQARLRQAFINQHLSLKTYVRGLDQAEASGRKLGFTDSETRDALGSLITATGSYKTAIKDLSVVQDFSRLKHVDATDAVKTMTMAMTGSQRAVKALGIVVIPVTANVDAFKKHVEDLTKAHHALSDAQVKAGLRMARLQDKYATGQAVIGKVTEKVKGQAKAFAQTAAGGLKIFRAQLDHLEIWIGAKFIPTLGIVTDKAIAFVGWLDKLAHAPSVKVAIDMVIAKGRNIRDDIQRQLDRVDWGSAGRQIATALGTGLVFTADMGNRLVGSLIGAVRAHAQDFATLGAELAVRLVATLLDPSFWAHHIDLLVALITVRFGGMFFKGIAGLGGRLGSRLAADIGRGLFGLLARVLGRLPVEVGVFFSAAARVAGRAFAPIAGFVGRIIGLVVNTLKGDFKRVLGALPGWIKAAFGVGAVVAFVGAIQKAADWVHRLWNFLKNIASRAWNAVVNVVVHVPHGGVAGKLLGQAGQAFLHQIPGQGQAAGGVIPMVSGAMRGVDSVPALLTPGEIVLNRAQQQVLGGPRYLQDLFGFERFAAGGTAKRKHRHPAPKIPWSIRHAETRAAGTKTKTDDIVALEREETWIGHELSSDRGLTPDQRQGLIDRRIRVRNRLRRLRSQVRSARTKASQRDYSQLPATIQERIARARYEHNLPNLLAALQAGKAWLQRQLRRHLTHSQRAAIYDALTSIDDEIKSVQDEMGAGSATGGPSVEDLQAQLEQQRGQTAAATLGEELANAFVATGVFAGGGRGGGSGGGDTYVFNSAWPPSPDIIDQVGRGATLGIGRQGFRRASRERLGL